MLYICSGARTWRWPERLGWVPLQGRTIRVSAQLGHVLLREVKTQYLVHFVASTTLNQPGFQQQPDRYQQFVDTPAQGTNNFLNIGNLIYGTASGTRRRRGLSDWTRRNEPLTVAGSGFDAAASAWKPILNVSTSGALRPVIQVPS